MPSIDSPQNHSGTVLASGTTTTVDIPVGWQRGGGVYRFELVFTDTDGRTEVPDNDPLLTLNSCSLCIATPTGSGISAKGQSTVRVASDDLIVLSNSLDAVTVGGNAVVRADSGKIRIKGGNAAVQPTLNAGTWTLPDGSYASVSISGTAPASIGPGRYGQLVMNGSALSLRPGVYVIESLDLGSGPIEAPQTTLRIAGTATANANRATLASIDSAGTSSVSIR